MAKESVKGRYFLDLFDGLFPDWREKGLDLSDDDVKKKIWPRLEVWLLGDISQLLWLYVRREIPTRVKPLGAHMTADGRLKPFSQFTPGEYKEKHEEDVNHVQATILKMAERQYEFLKNNSQLGGRTVQDIYDELLSEVAS